MRFPAGAACWPQGADGHICRNWAPSGPICLECAAIFRHLPLTIRCRLGDYTRAMMITRIHTIGAAILAAMAASGAAISPASAQSYPPPGAVYSPYPPAGAPADYRRGQRPQDFDALEDDDGPMLPPPGPVLSPDDPRYGR